MQKLEILRRIGVVLIPGAPLAARRRYVSGALVFITWALIVEAWIFLNTVEPAGAPAKTEKFLLTAAAAVYGIHLAVELVLFIRRGKKQESADELYLRALAAWTAGRAEDSLDLARRAARRGAGEADCLFLAANAAIAAGKRRAARRFLRKCRDFDEKGKWSWHVEETLRRL